MRPDLLIKNFDKDSTGNYIRIWGGGSIYVGEKYYDANRGIKYRFTEYYSSGTTKDFYYSKEVNVLLKKGFLDLGKN